MPYGIQVGIFFSDFPALNLEESRFEPREHTFRELDPIRMRAFLLLTRLARNSLFHFELGRCILWPDQGEIPSLSA